MEQLSRLRWPERAISLRARDDGVGRAAGTQASGAIALQAFCRGGPVTGGGEPVRSGAVAGGPGRRILCAEAARSGKRQRREITSLRKAAASIDPDRILQRVAEKCQVDRERLVARGGRGLHARNVAMWMIWETGNKSLREIGELFGGLDYATVAQRIRRTRSSHESIAAQKVEGHN